MDQIEFALLSAAGLLSGLLDPVAALIGRLHFFLRQQFTTLHLPEAWHEGLIVAFWVVVVLMLFRMLAGWARLALLLLTALVVAKQNGLLPLPGQ